MDTDPNRTSEGVIMKATIRSALCGFAVGVGITLALGASSASSSAGRFQITAAANYLAVIDTQTGQVWAGNFNQLGQAAPALEFRNCPQYNGDLFKAKTD